MPSILIAPDKFKNTLAATEVADEIASVIRETMPDATIRICPMADGGEGTAGILASHLSLQPASILGHDPMMNKAIIRYYESADTCAVDCAAIVGLQMLSGSRRLTPWKATSYPLGEFINEMLSKGKQKIIIGLGGSATIDGGIGMLQALGAQFTDVYGEPIPAPICAESLSRIFSIDFSGMPRADLARRIRILADVDLPLIPYGQNDTGLSSLSFAPQKGVADSDIDTLANALSNYIDAVDEALYPPSNQPRFQGAAGGLGYAFHRVLRCPASLGAEKIISMYNLFNPRPDLVITGEGSFDNQSFTGKATGTICNHASSANTPAIVITGRSSISKLPGNVTVLTTSPNPPVSSRNTNRTHHPDHTPTRQEALANLRATLRKTLPPAIAASIQNPPAEPTTETPSTTPPYATASTPPATPTHELSHKYFQTDIFKKTIKKIREKL